MAAKNESDSEHQSLSSLAQTLDSKISLESGKSVYTIESVYYDSGSSYDYETEVEGKHYEISKPIEPCGGACRCCTKYFDGIATIDAANLTFNPIDPGNWDEWGVYYCSSRYGRHTKFNRKYFALAGIMVIGQSHFFHLIHLMHTNGGGVFLLVLFLTYISFGYLSYLLQTLIGQYSGKKPVELIRLLAPICSGLGVAMYIRTMCKAFHVMGCFSICLIHFWDFLFCKGPDSVGARKAVTRERDRRVFIPLFGLEHPYATLESEEEFAVDKWLLFLCTLGLLVSFFKLKEFGAGMVVVLRLLLLFLLAYVLNCYFRLRPSVSIGKYEVLASNSLVYLPLQLTFKPDWSKLVDGVTWLHAMVFVMDTLNLDTLNNIYFGSKLFYHYRCTRDGIYLIFVTLTWHLIGTIGVLLWLGYVGINEKEIRAAFEEINGDYGQYVIFPVKHIQAELTEEVESDLLFSCAIFYFIMGLAALTSLVCYFYILTDCCCIESGHPITKLAVLVWYLIVFGIILLPIMAAGDGVRHLIFLHHYGCSAWVGLFIVLCFTFAVCWSQGMARVLHDFYNMIHLKGYEVITHYHQFPLVVVLIYIGYPSIALVLQTIYPERLEEGATDWSHPATLVLGYFILLLPIFAIVFGAVYYFIKERKDKYDPWFEPHRDFYKNKHHIQVCFKDYLYFDIQKIPGQVRMPGRADKDKKLRDL